MKFQQMIAAAGLVIASLGVSNVADAQGHRGDRHGNYERDRRDEGRSYRGNHRDDRDRNDRRGYRNVRNDRGRHYGWDRGRGRERCRIEYRHHQRVRICR